MAGEICPKTEFNPYLFRLLKVHESRFENLTIGLGSYKNITIKISPS